MNKKRKIYVTILLVIGISLLVIYHMYISDRNRMRRGEPVKYSNWGYAYSTIKIINTTSPEDTVIKDIQFTKTYKILLKLNKEDSTGKYNYYVLEEFQKDNPTAVKIPKDYTKLDIDKNYEFTFKGNKKYINKEYNIKDIFEEFEIVDINETDRERNRTNTRGNINKNLIYNWR